MIQVIQNEKSKEVRIPDRYNRNKVHAFRFYQDHHVTYNQVITGRVFYPKWQRINKQFGYADYLQQAKIEGAK